MQEDQSRLSLWGEFRQSWLEREYQQSILHSRKRSLYPVLVILAVVFALFLIPDLYANVHNPLLSRILTIRTGVILWLSLLVPMLGHVGTPKTLSLLLTFTQGLVGMTFLYLSSLYSVPDFTLQLLTFTLMILAFFVLPCSLWQISLLTLLLWGFFLFLASGRFADSGGREWLAAFLFPLLFLFVALSFRLRIEREQRRMFLLHQRLERLSEVDPLTGAANRYRFHRILEALLLDVQQKDRLLSVVLMDIDRFKGVNDRFGHQAGDMLLVGVCEVFRRHLRQHDLLVRWGGEEFALLLPDADEAQATCVAERIRASMEQTAFSPDGVPTGQGCPDGAGSRQPHEGNGSETILITGSFGVAQAGRHDSEKTLLSRADKRMYAAKALGRNQVVSSDMEGVQPASSTQTGNA
jgi:two-component system, cell cycle response regulator